MLALLTVFNSWAFLETRRLVQVFPEPVRKLWNNWELRVLVLVSLTLQLCLLHFGSRRRYSVKTWLSVFLWLSYLGADSVATVTLGVISNNQGNCNDSQLQNELIAFWAPFLLLHLGGQDTITAYAVQDNELWLRHLLGLVVQSGVALYILVLSWKVSWLSFLTIPMFLAGFIKYAERTWVLKSANNPTPTMRFMLGSAGMFHGKDPSSYPWVESNTDESNTESNTVAEMRAFILFKAFNSLYLNQKVHIYIGHSGYYSNFPNSQTAWKTIKDELGYAYDVHYTKAPLFFTAWGFLFRLFSFTSIVFVFVLFHIKERHKHPRIDLIITYLLLVGAVLIEIYAVILLCASNWPLNAVEANSTLHYSSVPRPQNNWLIKHVTHIRNGCGKLTSKQRGSISMGQLNLLDWCLKDFSLQGWRTTAKLFYKLGMPELFAKLREWTFNGRLLSYGTNKQVTDELKKLVYDTFWEKLRSNSNGFSKEYDKYIVNGTANVETYQSIVIWHFATDLCFYRDSGTNERDKNRKEISRDVSDYLMYILAMRPLAFSTGDAELGFEIICESVKYFFQVRGLSRKDKVCEQTMSEYSGGTYPGGSSSEEHLQGGDRKLFLEAEVLLHLAVELALKLDQEDEKWEVLSKFWVENLAYVAILCQGSYHAQLLSKGGEFLTHVWLLIEHFNLKESFQKSRTRPNEDKANVSPGSESGGRATGSVLESGYGRGSGNGSAAVSGADASVL